MRITGRLASLLAALAVAALAVGCGDGDGRRSRRGRDRDDDDRGRARRDDDRERRDGRDGDGAPAGGAFTLTSPAFDEGGTIPEEHSFVGANVSPALRWSGVPAGARSLVLAVTDPDAMGFAHWLVYGIPPSATGLPDGVPAGPRVAGVSGALQGTNDGPETMGYYGMEPPPDETHTYRFTLMALDTSLDLPPGATSADLADRIERHVIARAVLTARYGR